MKPSGARTTLAIIFATGLFINLGFSTYFYGVELIYKDSFHALSLKILAAYSVPLTIIFTGIFVKRRATNSETQSLPASILWISVGCTLAWNTLIIVRMLTFLMVKNEQIPDLISFFDTIVPALHFLMAAVLTYFFQKS